MSTQKRREITDAAYLSDRIDSKCNRLAVVCAKSRRADRQIVLQERRSQPLTVIRVPEPQRYQHCVVEQRFEPVASELDELEFACKKKVSVREFSRNQGTRDARSHLLLSLLPLLTCSCEHSS